MSQLDVEKLENQGEMLAVAVAMRSMQLCSLGNGETWLNLKASIRELMGRSFLEIW